jgi:MFS family permease
LPTFRSLRHRNYRLYFSGQLISLTGMWVQGAALTWLAYDMTGTNRLPAQVAAAQVVPTVLLGIWGGALADRWPRRALIIGTQSALLLLAVLLAGLVWSGAVTPLALLALSLGVGIVNAIDTPTRLAFVIDMVGREDLANAVALNSMLFNVARAIGPALAGWILPQLGVEGCFLFNALTYGAVLAALVGMHLPASRGPALGRGGTGSVGEALRYLGRRPNLLLLLALAGAMAFFGWPLLSLLPDVSVKLLNAGSFGYSWMLSGVGCGALLGALVVASFGSGRRIALLGGGVLTGCLGLGGLALVRVLPLAVFCCVVVGFGLILFFATGQAAMQLGSGDRNRGRILGVWLMVLSAAHPLGHLTAGYAADHWGVGLVLIATALGIGISAVLAFPLALAVRGRA